MAKNNYAATAMVSYISAIGFAHRLASLSDPTKTDMIKMLLRGCSRRTKQVDSRLPITLEILEKIIKATDHTITSEYRRKMMKSMCTTAFFCSTANRRNSNKIRTADIKHYKSEPDLLFFGYLGHVHFFQNNYALF